MSNKCGCISLLSVSSCQRVLTSLLTNCRHPIWSSSTYLRLWYFIICPLQITTRAFCVTFQYIHMFTTGVYQWRWHYVGSLSAFSETLLAGTIYIRFNILYNLNYVYFNLAQTNIYFSQNITQAQEIKKINTIKMTKKNLLQVFKTPSLYIFSANALNSINWLLEKL